MTKNKTPVVVAVIGALAIIISAVIAGVLSSNESLKVEKDTIGIQKADNGTNNKAEGDIYQPGRDNLNAGRDINQTNIYGDTTNPKQKSKSVPKPNEPSIKITQGNDGIAIIGDNATVNKEIKLKRPSAEILSINMNDYRDSLKTINGELISGAKYKTMAKFKVDFEMNPDTLFVYLKTNEALYLTLTPNRDGLVRFRQYTVNDSTQVVFASPVYRATYYLGITSEFQLPRLTKIMTIEFK